MTDTPAELSHQYWIGRWNRFLKEMENLATQLDESENAIEDVWGALNEMRLGAEQVLRSCDSLYWKAIENIYGDVTRSTIPVAARSDDLQNAKINIIPGAIDKSDVSPLSDYEIYNVIYYRALWSVSSLLGIDGMRHMRSLLEPHDPPIDSRVLRSVVCAPGLAAIMAFPATFIHFAKLSTLPLVQRIAITALSAWVQVRTRLQLDGDFAQMRLTEKLSVAHLAMELDTQVMLAFGDPSNDMASCVLGLQRHCSRAILLHTPLRSGDDPIRSAVWPPLRRFLLSQATKRRRRAEDLDLDAFEGRENLVLKSKGAAEALEVIRVAASKARLSNAEEEVLDLCLQGFSLADVARKRGTSAATASYHWASLQEKLRPFVTK